MQHVKALERDKGAKKGNERRMKAAEGGKCLPSQALEHFFRDEDGGIERGIGKTCSDLSPHSAARLPLRCFLSSAARETDGKIKFIVVDFTLSDCFVIHSLLSPFLSPFLSLAAKQRSAQLFSARLGLTQSSLMRLQNSFSIKRSNQPQSAAEWQDIEMLMGLCSGFAARETQKFPSANFRQFCSSSARKRAKK